MSVFIANLALTKLGSERILLLDDTSKQARVMKAIYKHTLEAELRAYWWKFAMKRGMLPALSERPEYGYQYAYPLPKDYLSLVQINELIVSRKEQLKPMWSIEAGKVLTDFSPPLKIRYVASVNDTEKMEPLFVEVLACKLAVEACETLTQSNTKKQMLYQEYQAAVNRAIQRSAIEKAPDTLPRGEWLMVRGSESQWGRCNG